MSSHFQTETFLTQLRFDISDIVITKLKCIRMSLREILDNIFTLVMIERYSEIMWQERLGDGKKQC